MLLHQELTDKILNAFYEVYNELGAGFLESVYQNALYFELLDRGFNVEPHKTHSVFYKGRKAGIFYSDLIVNELVILELKAVSEITVEHEMQLMNYLRASIIEVGYVLNFGKEPKFERRVFSNSRKKLPH